MAYKSISDIDMSSDLTKYGVEWEYENGHREWEWFNTAEEREAAIEANDVDAPPEVKDYWNDVATDAEADADTLASAGFGTDEDYNGGCYND